LVAGCPQNKSIEPIEPIGAADVHNKANAAPFGIGADRSPPITSTRTAHVAALVAVLCLLRGYENSGGNILSPSRKAPCM
jgi:hypothetical protein